MKKIQVLEKDTDINLVNESVHTSLPYNIDLIEKILGKTEDLVIRKLPSNEDCRVAVIHIIGIANLEIINLNIIEPLLRGNDFTNVEAIISSDYVQPIPTIMEVVSGILGGHTVVFVENQATAYLINTANPEKRSISEPTSQTVIRGPKDSFSEGLQTNVALIRFRLQNPNLRYESLTLGAVSQTKVGIMYVDGLVDEQVLKKVQDKLKKIDADSILESSYIERYLEENKFSLLPTLLNTERPDTAVANLLEGRVVILVEGTPYVLVAPATFMQFFQTPEDYYHPLLMSSFLRVLRFICFFIATLVPGIYIALLTHHQGTIPNILLVGLISQREGVPFPVVIEAIFMELVFEILREAGIRMPRAVGQAMSIVGALIIGEGVVSAGLISSTTVIIVSITALASFALPVYNLSNVVRILRFGFIFLSAFLGLYGLMLGMLVFLFHICALESFGFSYLSPIAPFRLKNNKDSLFRFPISSLDDEAYTLNKESNTDDE